MKRFWRNITDHRHYLVSNDGKVYSLRSNRELKPQNHKGGYLYVTFSYGPKGKSNHLIHRLVANAFIKNPKNKPTVNHINGIKTDNRTCNLEWATQRENNVHAKSIGINKYPAAKTSPIIVKKVRKDFSTGKYTQAELGLKYGVERQNIYNIVHYKSWKNI